MFVFYKINIFQLSSLWNRIVSFGSLIIGSVGWWVGGSVSKWSVICWLVVGGSMVGGFNETHESSKKSSSKFNLQCSFVVKYSLHCCYTTNIGLILMLDCLRPIYWWDKSYCCYSIGIYPRWIILAKKRVQKENTLPKTSFDLVFFPGKRDSRWMYWNVGLKPYSFNLILFSYNFSKRVNFGYGRNTCIRLYMSSYLYLLYIHILLSS